jgi:hypothetical protein
MPKEESLNVATSTLQRMNADHSQDIIVACSETLTGQMQRNSLVGSHREEGNQESEAEFAINGDQTLKVPNGLPVVRVNTLS